MNSESIRNWEEIWYKTASLIGDYRETILLIERNPEIQMKAVARSPELTKVVDDIIKIIDDSLINANILHKEKPIIRFNQNVANRLLRIASGDKTALWEQV